MNGSMVSFPSNGHNCEGYLSVPESGHGPGVVVIQEWWGLVPHIRDVCDRFAQEGFVALAPDLYHGEATTEPDEAGKRMMEMDFPRAARDLSGAVNFLSASEVVDGTLVGTVGFCMGGGLALYLASINPSVMACVPYYGVTPWKEAKLDLSQVHSAVLGHWAAMDHSTPREKVEELKAELERHGRDVEFFWYEGCDHAFFNDDRPEVYNEAAATQSWGRTTTFLRKQLTN